MMKFDLVIPLRRTESMWADCFELKYCLRSFEKYFPVNRVFVVCDSLPSWIQNVTLIEASDSFRHNKDANITLKVLAAAREQHITEIFYWSCDDHLVLRHPDESELIPFYHAQLKNEPSDYFTGNWKQGLLNTLNYLDERFFPTLNYDTHIPQPVCKEDFIGCFGDFSFREHVRYPINTMFHNQSRWSNIHSRHIGLRKATFEKAITNADDINKLMYNRLYMNYNNEGLTPELKRNIQQRFPNKSCYEKS